MGNASGISMKSKKISPSEAIASAKSQEIDAKLQQDYIRELNILKLLLLGPGESGKSTFVKQMKILHMQGFSYDDRRLAIPSIHDNTLEAMKLLLSAMRKFEWNSKDLVLENAIEQFNALYLSGIHRGLDEIGGGIVHEIWQRPNIQLCYGKRDNFYLPDSTKYFLDDAKRISAKDYTPTDEDMLRLRIATIGLIEVEFPYRHLTLKVIDVGGQRTQRRKWIHAFDNVTALLFIAALSDYDLLLIEDSNVDRMHDCLELFQDITHLKYFQLTPVILFLNKRDIFAEKLKFIPLTIAFPDYIGGQNFIEASRFVQEKFLSLKPSTKNIYAHITNATDTGNVESVFNATMNIVTVANVKQAGVS